jgi:hypothetical protein
VQLDVGVALPAPTGRAALWPVVGVIPVPAARCAVQGTAPCTPERVCRGSQTGAGPVVGAFVGCLMWSGVAVCVAVCVVVCVAVCVAVC